MLVETTQQELVIQLIEEVVGLRAAQSKSDERLTELAEWDERQAERDKRTAQAFSLVLMQLEELRFEISSSVHGAVSESEERMLDKMDWYQGDLLSELSAPEVARELRSRRRQEYEFFGVHTEQWQGDPDIAQSELGLFEVRSARVRPAAFQANRAELEAWRELGMLNGDGTPLERDELLERARMVIQCAEGNLAAEGDLAADPPKRIWAQMAESAEVREQLRKRHMGARYKSAQ